MSKDRYCHNCGFIYPGQRVGKCPNCDGSTLEEGRTYHISPDAIHQFEDFDKNGGNIESLRLQHKKITIFAQSPKKNWVTLSVYDDFLVTFADYGKGPQIIYHSLNEDGFSINDVPPKLLAEVIKLADEIIHGH